MQPVRLNVPRGRDFIRDFIARAVAGYEAGLYAEHRWGSHSRIAMLQRAAIGGVTSDDVADMGRSIAEEFFALVMERSIVGRLSGLRRVPLDVRCIALTTGVRGYWVGGGKAIPAAAPAIAGETLTPRKLATIIVATKESLETRGEVAEARLQDDIVRALVEALDEAFIDVGNTGVVGEMPASVTSGVSPHSSSANPAADVAALVEGFTGDLSHAYLVTDPVTAAQIGLARDSDGAFLFPDCGPRGGSVCGIPLLTSRGSPRVTAGGQIALIDGSSIAFGEDGVSLAKTEDATIEMADDPAGTSDDPTAMALASYPVSMFQTESVALKGVLRANWSLQRAGAVAVATGCSYPTSSS